MKNALFILLFAFSRVVSAQIHPDTIAQKIVLNDVQLVGKKSNQSTLFLPELLGGGIYCGKKASLVVMSRLPVVVCNNSMRQILAKVPGVHVWESDGSGIQIGIANRGLSPNRSWEFNVRQNGADISADPYGYPEAYYNPPMQATQRIQIVRGSGALLYGPQFGGMVNYILRDGSEGTKPLGIEIQQTIGTHGLLNSYVSVGGKGKKGHALGFWDRRTGDGFRANSQYETSTAFLSGTYHWTKKTNVTVELMQYTMLSQQPGGLVDSMVYAAPATSFRSRNWFANQWNTGLFKLQHTVSDNVYWSAQLSVLQADRKSVGFMGSIVLPDTAHRSTGQFAEREVAIDHYKNGVWECLRRQTYVVGKQQQAFTFGLRGFVGKTQRWQKGRGSRDSGADFTPLAPFANEFTFASLNGAMFAEHLFRFSPRWTLVPGLRVEWVATQVADSMISRSKGLMGMGSQYQVSSTSQVYGNITQNYRPVLFSDLSTTAFNERVDSTLRDAYGYTLEAGFRTSSHPWLLLDVGFFRVQYNNRAGRLAKTADDGSVTLWKTNVGNSVSQGVECLVDADVLRAMSKKTPWRIPVFVSYAFTSAQYTTLWLTQKNPQGLYDTLSLRGNRVENAPMHIARLGMGAGYKGWDVHAQWSSISGVFTDALNTSKPNATATVGYLPGYHILDINSTWKMSKGWEVRMSINNALNTRYATRRASGYPGPGMMPSDGRAALLSVTYKW